MFTARLGIGDITIKIPNQEALIALKSEKYKQIIKILGLEFRTSYYESYFHRVIDYETYKKEFSENKN